MYLILFVLDNPDKLNDLLDAWEKAGTGGATVLVSTGMQRMRGGAIRDDIPLMPGLDDFYKRIEEHHLFTIHGLFRSYTIDSYFVITSSMHCI